MKKENFKNLIKKKIKKHAFEYLLKKKVKHSKMDDINYKNFELQAYLKTQNIYPKDAQDIFKWRTNMQQFKINFSKQYENTSCIFQCDHEDSQQNILVCPKIRQKFPEIQIQIDNINYKDIYSNNLIKMRNTVQILNKLLECRKKMIEAQKYEAQSKNH